MTPRLTRARSLVFTCALLAVVAGCNKDAETPTTPTTGNTSFTQVFSGTLAPNTTQSFAFSLSSGTPVRLGLGSLTDVNENPISTPVTLTFGRPQGTGCGAVQTVTAEAALATQIHVLSAPGIYCVGITDTGRLASSALFAVRITQGDPSSTATAGTDTYTSVLFPGGFTSRSFEASTSGNVTVVMDSISPSSVASLNVGLGFPRTDGGGCNLTRTFVGTRGAQLTVPVEIGTYCVKVTDPGTLSGNATFSLRIVHP